MQKKLSKYKRKKEENDVGDNIQWKEKESESFGIIHIYLS